MNLVCHRPLKGDLVLLATNRAELTQVLDTYKLPVHPGTPPRHPTTTTCLRSAQLAPSSTNFASPNTCWAIG